MHSRYIDHDEGSNKERGIDAYWDCPLVSLERAVGPVLDRVENLAIALVTAKESCIRSPHGLKGDESAAIYIYTMEIKPRSIYVILNQYLRADDSVALSPWFSYIKLLSTALKKLPSYSGSVWRGVRGNVAKRYKKGMTFTWWSFTSCTKSLSIIQNFLPQVGSGTIFMIECIHGKEISAYSQFTHEDEILLLPEIKLIAVDDGLEISGMRVVHLKEIATQARDVSPTRNASSDRRHSSTSMNKLSPTHKSSAHKSSNVHTPSMSSTNQTAHGTKNTMTCPHCHSTLQSTSKCKEGTKITCLVCNHFFSQISCPHCSKDNIWKNRDHRQGEIIPCWSCKREFYQLNCPHCSESNVWKRSEYIEGRKVSCWSCKKKFQHLNCPHCSIPNFWKDADRKQGAKVPCWSCKKLYQHLNCPHCSQANVWKNANYISGRKITCRSCKKQFQHLNCPHCSKDNFYKTANYHERSIVTCYSCHGRFQHVVCPHCSSASFSKNADLTPGDRAKCFVCSKIF